MVEKRAKLIEARSSMVAKFTNTLSLRGLSVAEKKKA